MTSFELHVPPTVIYGKGSRYKAVDCIKKRSIHSLLIVSDKYLDEIGVVADITERVKSSGISCDVFTDMMNEPEIGDVENALAVFRDGDCDGILCIGGGSAIDTAKAVSVMAGNPGSIRDYMGYGKVKNAGAPLIAIPTTAGTGSEVTRVTIITDAERGVKMMCLDDAFMPDAAIVDYELTMTMPKSLTAYVGLDALTHAIEAYVSAKANAASDMFALRAIDLIVPNIMVAYNEPGNESARENMMLGANFAGIAFSNSSVCTVHGMSRPIGACFHIAHGLSNAMLLPLVTALSIEGNISRYAGIARHFGCVPDLPETELAREAALKLKILNNMLNIPNLNEYGIDKSAYYDLIPNMVDAAIKSGSPANNPKIFTPDEMSEIYKKAYDY